MELFSVVGGQGVIEVRGENVKHYLIEMALLTVYNTSYSSYFTTKQYTTHNFLVYNHHCLVCSVYLIFTYIQNF